MTPHLELLMQSTGSIALTVGVIFFAAAAVVAYVALRFMKKTVRMAVRMAIAAAVLLAAVGGSLSFWWFSQGTTQKQRPAAARPK